MCWRKLIYLAFFLCHIYDIFYLYIKIDTQITGREFEIVSTIAEAEVIAIPITVPIYTVYLQEDKIFTSIFFNSV